MSQHPTTSQSAIRTSPALSGQIFDYRDDQHSALVSGWNESELSLEAGATHFGFVQRGQATLTTNHGAFLMSAGMYFAAPGAAIVRGIDGAGFTVTQACFDGFFHLGGPIENFGRLRYIDGCTDSLLIAPLTYGDPCLNLLHIPPHTDQTPHTHPSLRVGMIVRGAGHCRTSNGDVALAAGLLFAINTDRLHSFHTRDESLLIVAWHPDSDFGPTHQQHPMVNRTIVDGRPVNSTNAAGESK